MGNSDSGGGIGLIAVLLLIAIAAHLLGYSGVARVAFWIAIGLLILVLLIVLILLIALGVLALTRP